MELINEIREGFAALDVNSGIKIKLLEDEYLTYILKIEGMYGVAIPLTDKKVTISEHFTNCSYFTRLLRLGSAVENFLILACDNDELRMEFSTVCSQFVDPGLNGNNRIAIINSPLDWWIRWRNLLGNAIKDKRVYNIIAEMLVLDYVYENDKSAKWSAISSSIHDIETDTEAHEVKSTLKRYGTEITISSQYQLSSDKNLYLYFCRLEESDLGISINNLVEKIVAKGYDVQKIEEQLFQLGLEKGASVRDKKYKIIEKKRYVIDDGFPKITDESFVGGHMPASVTHITYTINLSGVPFTNW